MAKIKGLTILFFLSAILFSCKEETRVNRVEGYLYNNCGEPASGAEVAFKANPGLSFTEPLVLATDICSSSGYFLFTYEQEETKSGTADLIVVEDPGYTTVLVDIPINKDQNLTAIRNNRSTILFNYVGPRVLTATDTLYYGFQSDQGNTEAGAAIGFKDTLFFDLPNTLEPATWITVHYGIGKNDYQISQESVSIADSIYNYVWIEARGCGDTDTLNISLQ